MHSRSYCSDVSNFHSFIVSILFNKVISYFVSMLSRKPKEYFESVVVMAKQSNEHIDSALAHVKFLQGTYFLFSLVQAS